MTALPAWLTKKAAKKVGGAVWDFLCGIPPIVYVGLLALVFALASGHYREQRDEARKALKAHIAADREAVRKANAAQVAREAKRDGVSGTVATQTREAAHKAVSETKDKTHARAEQIAAVAVSGACVAPVGLPDLAPAVEAANAAHR